MAILSALFESTSVFPSLGPLHIDAELQAGITPCLRNSFPFLILSSNDISSRMPLLIPRPGPIHVLYTLNPNTGDNLITICFS